MRLTLKPLGLLAGLALAACSSQQSGISSLPSGPNASGMSAPSSTASSTVLAAAPSAPQQAASVLAEVDGSAAPYALPANVRRACDTLGPEPDAVRCDALVRTDVRPAAKGQNVAGFGPADLQAAYNLPSSTNGAGQTIAIVDAYGYPSAESDLATYRSHFGLPACTTANGCFRKVNQEGKTDKYPKSNAGWDEEQALDLDMVSASCPNCNILLVEGNKSSFSSLGAAVDEAVSLGATVVTNSYGGRSISGAQYYDHSGVVILASAGDGGYGVQAPAEFPTVVSVGGTSLTKGGSGRGWAETVWAGTGSGCSALSKPAWQSDTGCTYRTMNDVAAVADPGTGVATYFEGWGVIGGTSVSSPLVAGIYGLAGNASTLNAAQSLYQNVGALYDVTSGENGHCKTKYLCHGAAGYDGPTGNGTPNGIGAF